MKGLRVVLLKMKSSKNKELAEELHKPLIRNFEKWKLHSSFINITWNSDLADMWLLRKFKKEFVFCLCYWYL